MFDRVLVGVDDTPEAVEAARQAAVLAAGPMTLVAVYDVAGPLVGGTGTHAAPYQDEDLQRRAAEQALRRAQEAAGAGEAKAVRGNAWDELLRELRETAATLAVVGSHGHGRAAGLLLGSTATELVHKAPCSVLVARAAGSAFPQRIVVGLDGSAQSDAAHAAARALAERTGGELRVEESVDDPVGVLGAAEADLVVVGSRGLHGLKSLGSVSERIAHRAPCSVLVVRAAEEPG